MSKPEIAVIGGGLAGLFSALQLSRAGFSVTLFEKKKYPFHKVCGEYISNESRNFIERCGIVLPGDCPEISKLVLTEPGGKNINTGLCLGGFGISRFTFDNLVYEQAKSAGADIQCGISVTDVKFDGEQFELELTGLPPVKADIVIGAQGKRSVIDQKLDRSFFHQRSPYLAVKYHVHSDYPADTIRLDLFKGGYCGLVKVDAERYCLCYLAHRDLLRKHHAIPEMEEQVLYRNPALKAVFAASEHLFEKPEVINEISFSIKNPVDSHIFMAGDSAGMIAPLCGNGMSMAMHSSKILSELIISIAGKNWNPSQRILLEKAYTDTWNQMFPRRLYAGKSIQFLFRHPALSAASIQVLRYFSRVTGWLISKTHGKSF